MWIARAEPVSEYPPSDAKRRLVRFAAVLAEPVGWPTHFLATTALLWVCWDARFPGAGIFGGSLGVLVWAWVLLVWLSRPLTGLVIRLWSRQPLRPSLVGWGHWTVVPLLLGVNYAAIAYAVPSRVAFRFSRPALDRLAQAVLMDAMDRPKQWAGIIPISRAGLIQGAVQFDYDRREFPWGQRGLYFTPDGRPVDNSRYYSQRKLEDGWYCWHYGGW